MNGKPVLYREGKTVLTVNAVGFQHEKLCDGLVLNPGDACGFSCAYCHVGPAMIRVDKPLLVAHEEATGKPVAFQNVVIRREGAVDILKSQLFTRSGKPKFSPDDRRVVYGSTLVDVAANKVLLAETAELCNLLFDHTGFQIRLLSKSASLARLITDRMIPARHHERLILGFSTGTIDDRTAAAIERCTSSPTARIKAPHTLQDRGIRTFGMICPSLPKDDYKQFSDDICTAIRADRCEHVWAEAINLRGKSLTATANALRNARLIREAQQLESVSGRGTPRRLGEIRKVPLPCPCLQHPRQALQVPAIRHPGKPRLVDQTPAPGCRPSRRCRARSLTPPVQ